MPDLTTSNTGSKPQKPAFLSEAGFWSWLSAPQSIAPLVTFRVLFGLLMAYGAIRFMLNGWIEKLYGEPTFFFKFYGFHWVTEPSVAGAYALYFAIAISAIFISIGFLYRLSVIVFFLTFSWAELIDATNYLNHYYLVCLLAILLFFVPANAARSVDVIIWPKFARSHVPAWHRYMLILQLSIVYFFAGLAKLNPDWIMRAMPLAIWLPEHSDLPLVGSLLKQEWVAYAFSWFGAFYDLTIVAWLLWKPSRPFAYLAVLAFHLMTWMLFNIGLFPLIMITSTLIFFAPETHASWWQIPLSKQTKIWPPIGKTARVLLLIFFAIQFILPLRILAYPGSTFWTEEGYRFGWRVMLVEKNGQATFAVHDPATNRVAEVNNKEFLTDFQEKQMAIQPDFMLQYAKHLAGIYAERYNITNPKVTADVFVALNGRTSQRFIDPEVDLVAETDNLLPKTWILPLAQ